MPYCSDCGVELAPDARHCPLCGKPIDVPHEQASHEHYIDPEDRERLTDKERRIIVWETLSVSALIAALTVAAINFLVAHALTWSLYPLFSLAFIWVVFTSPLLLAGRPFWAVLLPAIALPAFLIGLDAVDGRLSWAPPVALPIAFTFEALTAAAAFFIRASKRKGANVIAYALLAIAGLCVGIEATVDHFVRRRVVLGWSAIVAIALVPIALFLFYLHYRIGRKTNLRKLFRL